MTFFFYGEDSFRSRQKLREVVLEYQKVRSGGLNLILLDFEKDSFDDFLEKVGSLPLFASKRLIILQNAFLSDSLTKHLLKYFKDKPTIAEDTNLVFFEVGVPRSNHPLFVFLKKTAKTQEFGPLPSPRLSLWVKKEVELFGGKITIPAQNRLVVLLGNDLWALENEIKSLVAFKKGQIIEVGDLTFLPVPRLEASIFKTIDAIANHDTKTALELLDRHWGQGDSPIYLLSMVGYQFRNLLLVKNLLEKGRLLPTIVKMTGLNPFVARRCLSQADKFTFPRLKQIYAGLLETDRQIKTGRVNPRQGLEFFVSTI